MKQRAAKGEGEAQFSHGCVLVSAAGGDVGLMGASGRSPMADAGLELSPHVFLVARQAEARRCAPLTK